MSDRRKAMMATKKVTVTRFAGCSHESMTGREEWVQSQEREAGRSRRPKLKADRNP